MRFQCTFCLSLIDTNQDFGTQLNCPSCKRKCFVPRSRFSENRVIGDFVIREKIGGGSAGKVYKATQLSLGRTVALKILIPDNDNPKNYEDFMHEARAAAKLNHVNLIQALALGEEDGIYYMAMNLVDGETLKARLLRAGRLEVDEALHIAQQVAEALWYAWENAHMVHRDVKPENIMITNDGIVKLTDMGLAVILSEFRENSDICGSPSYMSPEQLAGGSPDTRSDIYSLGITLYEMLAGELPFKATTFEEVAAQHFTEDAVPLRRLDHNIPIKVSNLVRQMIEKLPEDRFDDMNELLDEIWQVRQATAPDSAMIPDVHTISINRLNYELQRQAVKVEAETAAEVPPVKKRDSFVPFIIISVILFLLMVASYGYQYYLSRASEVKNTSLLPLKERVDLFEKSVQSGEQSAGVLEAEGDSILSNFPKRRDEATEELFWKVRFYLSDLKERSASAKLKDREGDVKDLKNRLDGEQQWHVTLNDEILQLKKTNDLMQNKMKTDEKAAQDQLKKLQAELDNLKRSAQAVNTSQEHFWKNQFLVGLYSAIRSRDYSRARAFVQYQSATRSKSHEAWLKSYQDLLGQLEELDTLFYSKTSRLTKAKMPNEGQVVMIDSGAIFYQSGSAVRSRPWYEFDIATLQSLVSQAGSPLSNDPGQFEALLAVYGGNMAYPALNKASESIKEIRQAVLEASIESIQVTAYHNRTQAAAEAAALLERFRHDPDLAKEITNSLKSLLGQ